MTDSVLDLAVFNEISSLMEDALGEFIDTYLENTPKLLANLQAALAEKDLQAVFHHSHQLKGGSGSIGAAQVFECAKQIEERARAGNAEGLDALFNELQQAYEKVATELKTYQ